MNEANRGEESWAREELIESVRMWRLRTIDAQATIATQAARIEALTKALEDAGYGVDEALDVLAPPCGSEGAADAYALLLITSRLIASLRQGQPAS